MRRTFLFGLACTFILSGFQQASAENTTPLTPINQIRWDTLEESEKALIDCMAADFFENALRLSQSRRIEASTAKAYLLLSPLGRKGFREHRQAVWQEMTMEQKHALRNVKHPSFQNLTEAQKYPFRQHALEFLGWGDVFKTVSDKRPKDI